MVERTRNARGKYMAKLELRADSESHGGCGYCRDVPDQENNGVVICEASRIKWPVAQQYREMHGRVNHR
jgi:hypothetical protein